MTVRFVEIDAQTLYDDLILRFQKALEKVLKPADERRIFLEQEMQTIVAIYNAIDDTGKQNLLRHARGEVLDAIGERTDTTRLPAKKATATLRFTLSGAQGNNVIIPAGIRATPDGVLFFALINTLTIIAGQTYGDGLAEATETGPTYNDYTAGQINQLVDSAPPFVASVANTNVSSGGADIEADDDGANVWSGYRERIRESPSKFSTAGPEDAYIYWAKTAHQDIVDVSVSSPAASEIKITTLLKNGELPTQTILDDVLTVCSGKKVRPQTDLVSSTAPDQVDYDIIFTYYINENDRDQEATIRNAIEGTGKAVDQYKSWQDTKMGRAINPDELRKLVKNAGARRLVVTEPVYTVVDEDDVAKCGTITITYGGLEEG